ncbi:uncharacterized protein PHALS_02578 [Plasmopara halstedii]|uniref:Uncharacterized protein n=1 Tax=Plasmopara halstedii TaxID=4781 RepID=A0A0P1AUW7_PLAHL|nr:uncharacterized protein PHALS_02578 [Plasmopara halstedii]CEG46161.1 hypothetical protein PHALS_02578 [Plasmopara halstedii]|eukprot:XP_024582530.1 hypothetical protein PHALS_02578 [Plasmopara halstedii]
MPRSSQALGTKPVLGMPSDCGFVRMHTKAISPRRPDSELTFFLNLFLKQLKKAQTRVDGWNLRRRCYAWRNHQVAGESAIEHKASKADVLPNSD